jgi:Ran GTPase-activating protein (RanGAP) involved in mRNA processing and transport
MQQLENIKLRKGEIVQFINTEIKPKEWSLLCDLLTNNAVINKLELRNNKIGSHRANELANALSKSKNIKELIISSNEISETGAIEIFNSMAASIELALFVFEDNLSGDEAFSLFTKLSNNFVHLKKVNFDGCQIGDEGIRGIGSLLQLPTLKCLSLCRNLIGEEGLQEIGKNIQNSNLECLYLGDNDFGNDGLEAFFSSLEKSEWGLSLQELHLPKNKLTEIGPFLQKESFVFKSIKKINLAGNKFTNESAEQVLISLPPTITEFNLTENFINSELLDKIKRLIAKNAEEEEIRKRSELAGFSHCTAGFGKRTI